MLAPPQVKQIFYVIESKVVLLSMGTKALVFKIQIESLLATNKTDLFLVLLDLLFLFSQLRKLIDDGPRKYLGNYLQTHHYVYYLGQHLTVQHHVSKVTVHVA